MNNARRKAITDLVNQLDELKGKLEDLKSEVESIKDEEQEYYNNMPESLQGSEKGQNAEHADSCFETAVDKLDEAFNAVYEAVSNMEEARDV